LSLEQVLSHVELEMEFIARETEQWMQRLRVKNDFRFTAQAWKEGSAYVAYSPELDVSSCGDSPAQAKSRLREAAAAFLEEAARMGTLKELFFRFADRCYRSSSARKRP
jgi:predicted RNase H-like HicB family nuclease